MKMWEGMRENIHSSWNKDKVWFGGCGRDEVAEEVKYLII